MFKSELNDKQFEELKELVKEEVAKSLTNEVTFFFWRLVTGSSHVLKSGQNYQSHRFHLNDEIAKEIGVIFKNLAKEHYADNLKEQVDDYLASEEFLDNLVARILKKQLK